MTPRPGSASPIKSLKPTDALTLAGVVAVIGSIALVAAIAPARKAAGVDPLRALRYD